MELLVFEQQLLLEHQLLIELHEVLVELLQLGFIPRHPKEGVLELASATGYALRLLKRAGLTASLKRLHIGREGLLEAREGTLTASKRL